MLYLSSVSSRMISVPWIRKDVKDSGCGLLEISFWRGWERTSNTFIHYSSSHPRFETSTIQIEWGSSVGIETDYGLDATGIESRCGRDFPPVQTGPGAHPASCTMGTGSFLGVKCGRGVLLTTHLLLAPRSWKSRAIPLTPSGPQPGL